MSTMRLAQLIELTGELFVGCLDTVVTVGGSEMIVGS